MFKPTMIKFNKVNEGGEGSGSGYETPPPTENEPKNTPPPEAPGDTDEFGYAKPPAPEQSGKEGDGKKDETKKGDEKAPAKEEQQDPVSGYSEDPPKVDPPKEDPAPEKKADDKPKDEGLGYELETKDLDPNDAEKIKNFAKNFKLSEDAAKAFVELKKSEMNASKQAELERQKDIEKAIAETKAKWHKELKDDAKFGGENFARNVHKVDKLLNQFMTETKKTLTERKSMLPPYVMRDLSKLADQLFGTENLVMGDERSPSKNEDGKKENDPLAFYNS